MHQWRLHLECPREGQTALSISINSNKYKRGRIDSIHLLPENRIETTTFRRKIFTKSHDMQIKSSKREEYLGFLSHDFITIKSGWVVVSDLEWLPETFTFGKNPSLPLKFGDTSHILQSLSSGSDSPPHHPQYQLYLTLHICDSFSLFPLYKSETMTSTLYSVFIMTKS